MSNEKQFETITCDAKAIKGETNTFEFVGTTGSRDRMGDELTVTGWDMKAYRKNPVFLWAHDYSSPPIGKVKRIQRERVNDVDGWTFKVEFAPTERAQELRELVAGGFLKAVSVGFRPLKSKYIDESDDEKAERLKSEPDARPWKEYLKKELLELSLVPVPANADALLVARRKGMAMPKELTRELDHYEFAMRKTALETTRMIRRKLDEVFEAEQEKANSSDNKPDVEASTGGGDITTLESAIEEYEGDLVKEQEETQNLEVTYTIDPKSFKQCLIENAETLKEITINALDEHYQKAWDKLEAESEESDEEDVALPEDECTETSAAEDVATEAIADALPSEECTETAPEPKPEARSICKRFRIKRKPTQRMVWRPKSARQGR